MKTEDRSVRSPSSAKTSRTSRPRRVFVVDGHPIVVYGITRLLEGSKDLFVGGSAVKFESVLTEVSLHPPDIILIEISLPNKSGIELLMQLRVRFPSIPILVFSIHDETLYAVRCLRAVAAGYLMKTATPELLLVAIRAVLAGDVYVSQSMGKKMMRTLQPSSRSPLEDLNEREFQVFKLLGMGFGTRKIATELGVSGKTVTSHCYHIKLKFGFRTVREIADFAKQWMSL